MRKTPLPSRRCVHPATALRNRDRIGRFKSAAKRTFADGLTDCESSILLVAVCQLIQRTQILHPYFLTIDRAWIREESDGWWLVPPPSSTKIKGTPTRIPLNTSALWALRDSLPSLTDGRVFRRWNDSRAFKKYWARACAFARFRICTSTISDTRLRPVYRALATIMR